ncbi:MAG TPA: hypothetical protein VMB71_00895 [Acetobacteraceae bacterium]|nr:hypothetical protein [Acetobacteraceae bacterium]
MSDTISVPIRVSLFLELYEFLKENGSSQNPVDVVDTAISYWMSNASWKPEDLMPRSQHLGYQWKPLFLPPQTKIRMRYKGKTFYACVIGDDIIFDGRSVTPGEFANSIAGGTNRNAWRDLWIKLPHESDFRLADDLRRPTMTLADVQRAFSNSDKGTEKAA